MAQILCKSKHGRKQKQHGDVRFFMSEAGYISEPITDDEADVFVTHQEQFFEHYTGKPVPLPEGWAPRIVKAAPAPVVDSVGVDRDDDLPRAQPVNRMTDESGRGITLPSF